MTTDATRSRSRICIVDFAVAVCVAAMLSWAGPAAADNAPQLACGNTQPGPSSETAHFTSNQGFVTPIPSVPGSSSCPAYLLNDIAFLNFTGHGVEHITVNKAQDAWFTETFTGTGTVTAYPSSSLAKRRHG
ncbi:MAG: hypothetical protein ABI808_10405 [Pseudonocardiales bacterium]